MKTSRTILLSLCIFLLGSCAIHKWKRTLVSEGYVDEAISNAVTDFIHTSKVCKKGDKFWVEIKEKEKTIIISISLSCFVEYPTLKNKVGSYDPFFPSRYIEQDRKLFYWNDSTQMLTQDMLSMLEKYDLIDYSYSDQEMFVGGMHNDGAEGMNYFFCKDNLRIYKKSKISNIMKHYKTPVLEWEK